MMGFAARWPAGSIRPQTVRNFGLNREHSSTARAGIVLGWIGTSLWLALALGVAIGIAQG